MWTSVGFGKNVREKIIEGIETAYVRRANALCRVGLRRRLKISPQYKPALLQFLQSLVRLVGNITTRARTKSLIYMNKINFLK
jgi:hypothetical protein